MSDKKASNNKKAEGAVKETANKTPAVKIREKAGFANISIRNGGRAGRIFLLNEDGTFVGVVDADKFVETWNSESIARSKKGLGEGVTQFLSTKCKVAPEQKDEIVSAIKSEFKAIMKLVQDGLLKQSGKAKVEIIPLI